MSPRVLCNVGRGREDWSIHFIAPDGRTRIGPWLLLDTYEEVLAILSWGNPSGEEMAQHEQGMRQWNLSSVALDLTGHQLAGLYLRGRGWPWNGYELRKMKAAGKYPQRRRQASTRLKR
jgi:hypothetical protein